MPHTRTRLNSNGAKSNGGSCPPLNANYRKYVGFAHYAKTLSAAGAGFYIIGSGTKKLLKIDFHNSTLTPFSISDLKLKSYSPRTRIISDEPALNSILNKARSQYHISNPEVLLLIPQVWENKLASLLLKALKEKNLTFKDVAGFEGIYIEADGRLILKIFNAVRSKTGQPVKLNIAIYI